MSQVQCTKALSLTSQVAKKLHTFSQSSADDIFKVSVVRYGDSATKIMCSLTVKEIKVTHRVTINRKHYTKTPRKKH